MQVLDKRLSEQKAQEPACWLDKRRRAAPAARQRSALPVPGAASAAAPPASLGLCGIATAPAARAVVNFTPMPAAVMSSIVQPSPATVNAAANAVSAPTPGAYPAAGTAPTGLTLFPLRLPFTAVLAPAHATAAMAAVPSSMPSGPMPNMLAFFAAGNAAWEEEKTHRAAKRRRLQEGGGAAGAAAAGSGADAAAGAADDLEMAVDDAAKVEFMKGYIQKAFAAPAAQQAAVSMAPATAVTALHTAAAGSASAATAGCAVPAAAAAAATLPHGAAPQAAAAAFTGNSSQHHAAGDALASGDDNSQPGFESDSDSDSMHSGERQWRQLCERGMWPKPQRRWRPSGHLDKLFSSSMADFEDSSGIWGYDMTAPPRPLRSGEGFETDDEDAMNGIMPEETWERAQQSGKEGDNCEYYHKCVACKGARATIGNNLPGPESYLEQQVTPWNLFGSLACF